MRYASNIICPFKFNYEKYKDKIEKELIATIKAKSNKFFEKFKNEIKLIDYLLKKYKYQNKSSKIFGELLEMYVEKKFKNIILEKQKKVKYNDIVGVCDFLTGDSIIEIKYSTIIPTKNIIEEYKRQAIFYAKLNEKRKFVIIAGNPVEDKIEIFEDEIKNYDAELKKINAIINGFSMVEPGYKCLYCHLKNKCPIFTLRHHAS